MLGEMEGERSLCLSLSCVVEWITQPFLCRPQLLNASEKSKFEDLAKADKVRYDKEMKNYVPPKGVGKAGRKKKDPNAPKRPPYVPPMSPEHAEILVSVILTALSLHRSAFFVFCSEYRPTVKSENPGLSIGETAKKLGEMWSKQGIKDRAPFEQKAMKLREKYEKVGKILLLKII